MADRVDIEKFGDWEKVRRMLRNLPSDMEKSRQLSLKRTGLMAEREAKLHLSKQDLKWRPLSESYRRRKQKRGLSGKTLIATSSYMQAITSYTMGDTAFAGVKRTVKNKDGEEIANIARVMEYGSKKANIPARPLWGPTFRTTARFFLTKGSPLQIFKKIVLTRYGVRI